MGADSFSHDLKLAVSISSLKTTYVLPGNKSYHWATLYQYDGLVSDLWLSLVHVIECEDDAAWKLHASFIRR